MKPRYLVAANWKMNFTPERAAKFADKLASDIGDTKAIDLVVVPNFVALPATSEALKDSRIKLGAQNVSQHLEGAYTGETSVQMVKGLVKYVLVGHSERRHIFHETEQDIRFKVQAILRAGLKPILCVGDTATQHANGEMIQVVRDQLLSGLTNVSSDELKDIVIAYEPVWAISSGRDFARHATPTNDEVSAVMKEIRRQLKALFGAKAADKVRLLYGGSVSPDNVEGYMQIEDLRGFLVGGAGLSITSFRSIVNKIEKYVQSVGQESKE